MTLFQKTRRTAIRRRIIAAAIAALASCVLPLEASAQSDPTGGLAVKLAAKVEQSQIELNNVRRHIEQEVLPLKQEMEILETKLLDVRKNYDQILRTRDLRTLDLSNLKAKIEAKKKQSEFLANNLDEFIRNFEARLHISEVKRYGGDIDAGKNRAGNANLSAEEQVAARLEVVDLAFARIEGALGGSVFEGAAVDSAGVVGKGKFIIVGPLAYFAGDDDSHVGIARSNLNSSEPSITPVPGSEDAVAAIKGVATNLSGDLPVDSSGGNALKLAAANKGVVDQIKKGGAVMYPLLTLGGISMLIGLLKWIQLSRVKRISPRRFDKFMACLVNGEHEKADKMAAKVTGPLGELLMVASENIEEPRELLEEIMYEKELFARGKLNSFLPFIKVTAAASPLLGLLGTVSGMINTFKMITIYGTGDAQTFSGGISEALITTQWGLIVAIPCLLLAAFLSRKAKAVTDDMEKLGIGIINGLPEQLAPDGEPPETGDPPPTRPQQGPPAPENPDIDDEPDLGDLAPEGA